MKETIVTTTQVRNKSVFAFLIFLLAFVLAYFLWKALWQQPKQDGVQTTLRAGLNTNAKIFGAAFSPYKLVKTYPVSEAVKKVRVNGDLGLKDASFDATTWRLILIKTNNDTLHISLDDIKRLPKTEIVFDFKCIEGWSQKTWWGGVRFSDFIKQYGLDKEAMLRYASLVTPDGAYYVGIDMPSMLQAQTILCYEMNGAPLPMNQGYPLRLIIPVKYGIKHLKRIGTLSFSNTRPKDYWAEQGYDYYAGH